MNGVLIRRGDQDTDSKKGHVRISGEDSLSTSAWLIPRDWTENLLKVHNSVHVSVLYDIL